MIKIDPAELNYELIIEFFRYDPLYFKIELFQADNYIFVKIIQIIDDFISKRNKKSEKLSGEYGYIHNWFVKEIVEDCMIYQFDYGSGSILTLNLLLKYLNKVHKIKSITITSNYIST